jgi:putative flippase GtrA
VRRFWRFCLVGAMAYAVDAALLTALVSALAMNPYGARVASFLAAATFTWWLNRRYTFEVAHRPTRAEWMAYMALMGIGAGVNYATYAAAITWWPLARAELWLAVALGSIAGLGVNFATSRRLFSSARPNPR